MRQRASQLQRISRRGLISSGVLAGVLAATGVQVQARTRGGVLRLGLSGTAADWDPRAGQGSFMRVALAGAVYETLTEIRANGELTGELATSWEPSQGAMVWTVNLRRGVLFHDGREVTATDVAQSFALHRDASPAGWILDRIAGIRVLGDHLIGFDLTEPDANFPLLLADPHLVVAPGGVFDGTGSGLYRVAEFLPGERLRLSRADTHHRDGSAGWFDVLVLRAMPDAAARTAALIAGHVDAIDYPAEPERIAARRSLHLLESPGHGLAFDAAAIGPALAGGLPVRAGAPDEPVARVHPAYAEAGLTDGRYGAGLENLMPQGAAGDAAIAGHLPFTLAHADRLRHDDGIGTLWPMDSGRIAERWWFA